MGRPSKLTEHQKCEAIARRDRDIARTFGVSLTTIGRLRRRDRPDLLSHDTPKGPQPKGLTLTRYPTLRDSQNGTRPVTAKIERAGKN
jgi:hypothetical protein